MNNVQVSENHNKKQGIGNNNLKFLRWTLSFVYTECYMCLVILKKNYIQL